MIRSTSSIPIFPRHGNRLVAVNPALVRCVETQASGGCKIIFDHQHEMVIDTSLHEVMRALWGSAATSDIKELTVQPA